MRLDVAFEGQDHMHLPDLGQNHIEVGSDDRVDVVAAVVGLVGSSLVDPDMDVLLEQLIVVDKSGLVDEAKSRKDVGSGVEKQGVDAGCHYHQHQ